MADLQGSPAALLLFPLRAVIFDQFLKLFGLGQRDEIAGDKELAIQSAGGVFDLGRIEHD